jgi:Domain of Unknown Function (DUF928)
MNWTKFSVAMTVAIAYLFTCNAAFAASPATSAKVEISVKARQNQPLSRGNSGKNGNRGPAGRRTGCDIATTTKNENLYALVPVSGEETYTSETTPMLWFYIPYASTRPILARLTLQSEKSTVADYAKTIPLSGTPGVVGVQLPQSLAPGTSYRWYFTIMCDEKQDGGSVDGWIQRSPLSSNIMAQINNKSLTLKQRLDLYQQNNLWHDRLTLLATQVNKNAQAKVEWKALLQEIELEKLQPEAVLGFYVVK